MAATESTRCPHCRTAFRVTGEQLAAARGAVRCGSCLKVFNAREHLLDPATRRPRPGPATERRPEQPFRHAPEPADESRRFAADDDELLFGLDADEDLVFMDDEDDETDELDFGEEKTVEFSDSFLALDDELPQRRDAVPRDQEPDTDAGADDSWALDMLADIEREEQAQKPERHDQFSLQGDEQPIAFGRDSKQKSPAAPSRRHTTLAHQDLDDLAAAATAPHRHQGLWLSAALLAVVLIALQMLWWERDRLSQQPVLAPLYAQACQWVPCQLADRGPDVGAIRALSSVLRPLPDGRMRLDAVFINRGDRPAPFPVLRLSIRDGQGEVVADGLFAPEDYVGGELQPGDLMPAGRPISISLNINQPVDNLGNFQLTFHY